MRRSPFLGLALAVAVGLGACDSMDPLGPGDDTLDAVIAAAASGNSESDENGNGNGATRGPGGFTLFEDLSEQIPTFGGLYRESACHVVVVLTDLGDADQASALVEDLVSPLVPRCSDGVRVEAVLGDYTFVELSGFLDVGLRLARLNVVEGAWLDFALNRMVLRIDLDTQDAVIEALTEHDVPVDAVVFIDVDDPTRPGQSGSDDSRD